MIGRHSVFLIALWALMTWCRPAQAAVPAEEAVRLKAEFTPLGAEKVHVNPDHVRWELHRVWVVEARLATGKRHVVARRRLYLDEDTWLALVYDGWDASGHLRHAAHALPLIVPELPAVVSFPDVIHDLLNNRYAARYLLNDGRLHYQVVARRPDYFSPAALVGEGIR